MEDSPIFHKCASQSVSSAKVFELVDTHNLLVFRFGCKVMQNFRYFQIFLAENYFTRSVRKNNANFSCKYGKLYLPLPTETITTNDNEHNEKQVTSEIPLDGFGAL
jgi:hypothetical protein